jgi:hypothetical protein
MIFNQTLYVHWKAARWLLLPLVLLCFGLPQLMLRMADTIAGTSGGFDSPSAVFLVLVQGWTPVFPLLALLIGSALALTAWSWDHRGDHVYALSLPLHRREYALLKFAGGALLLVLPVAAALAGILSGLLMSQLPAGLQAYPVAFTGRFLLASVIAYAVVFALAAGTMRTTLIVVLGTIAVLVFGSLLMIFLQDALQRPELWTPLDVFDAALNRWPGPFHVFGGSWLFIDV